MYFAIAFEEVERIHRSNLGRMKMTKSVSDVDLIYLGKKK